MLMAQSCCCCCCCHCRLASSCNHQPHVHRAYESTQIQRSSTAEHSTAQHSTAHTAQLTAHYHCTTQHHTAQKSHTPLTHTTHNTQHRGEHTAAVPSSTQRTQRHTTNAHTQQHTPSRRTRHDWRQNETALLLHTSDGWTRISRRRTRGAVTFNRATRTAAAAAALHSTATRHAHVS